MASERALRDVPLAVLSVALIAAILQILTSVYLPVRTAQSVEELPPAPTIAALHTAAAGEEALMSRLVSLWLQAFDYQSGISISWRSLDYQRLADWLDVQLLLDPDNPFPMLAASHLYGGVEDRRKVRVMVDYVVTVFERDPARYWRWMATAAITARHRLNDLELAERIAAALDAKTRGIAIPSWARQMHIFLKADLGEKQSAAALLLALIKSGEVKRPEEIDFLKRRLLDIRQSVEKSSEK